MGSIEYWPNGVLRKRTTIDTQDDGERFHTINWSEYGRMTSITRHKGNSLDGGVRPARIMLLPSGEQILVEWYFRGGLLNSQIIDVNAAGPGTEEEDVPAAHMPRVYSSGHEEGSGAPDFE